MLSEQSFFTETIFQTHLCTIYVIIRNNHIAHLSFSNDCHLLALNKIRSGLCTQIIKKNAETNNPICVELKEYLAGLRQNFNLTPDPFFLRSASPLRQRIWQQIAAIPYGNTVTYADIGRQLGNPFLARTIGQAAKANPLPLLIPCHRVTAKNNIGGYAGGAALKKHLLQLERNKGSDWEG